MFKRARILGVGRTPFFKQSNRSVLSLALEATENACADAGIEPQELDGVATYEIDDSIPALSILNALGCPDVAWFTDLHGGANVSLTALLYAAMVVDAGLAQRVVVFRAINGRSESRLGGTGHEIVARQGMQYTAPVGWTTYGQIDAMMARRHMALYGTTSDQLGAVAISTRAWALPNEWAVMRTPLTLDEYRRSPLISSPFRLLDYCQESDFGYAVIIGTAGSSATPSREIEILSGAHGAGRRPGADNWGHVEWHEHATTFSHYLRDRLFARAGMSHKDFQAVYLYDCFTFTVISQLEGFGFVPVGEGGPFVETGAIGPGGSLAVNSHGGLLSEGYGHGMNALFEAVTQLRGEAGPRQLPRLERTLLTGGATTTGCAVVIGVSG